MTITPKPRLVAVAAASALFASAAHAGEPFQWEVGGDYLAREVTVRIPVFDGTGAPIGRVEEDFDSDILVLGAQWFLEPVTADSGPLEQAAFLERATSLSAAYVRTDADDFGEDGDAVGFSGRYQFDTDWFVTGGLSRSEFDSVGPDIETTTIEAGVGRYLGDGTALSLSVTRDEAEISTPGFTFDDDFTFYELNLEHVGDLGDHWQYAVDASLIVPDGEFDESGLGLAVTLYPSRNLGFGFDLTAQLQDRSDSPAAYAVFGRWFINEAWSVSARYEWLDQGASAFSIETDDEALGIGVRYRF